MKIKIKPNMTLDDLLNAIVTEVPCIDNWDFRYARKIQVSWEASYGNVRAMNLKESS